MSEQTARSLAGKINHLFDTIRRRDGHEYSNTHVAAAIAEAGVTTISQSYIWQLRKGEKTNPTINHLQALADFFGVPVAYFFDDEVASRVERDAAALEEQARANEAMGGSEAKLMAMRAGELSPQRRKQVMDLLDVVYQLEQAERRSTTND
ncbi:transcriptional regulator with XRE-family HTH domain [Streptacidiphilus sp. BW17]|uniref:helix-turn-helix domain-containing protein n=1 Tax=Streptacidiphilus sp. BW17 TaxID=3156274 RepID=UPI00351873B0